MYFYHTMHTKKEKRLHERIPIPDLKGSVEIREKVKPVTVVNASTEGVCISGAHVPVGSVVRLAIDELQDIGNISLYCKVAWASGEAEGEKFLGLSFLNTNKILFKKDLVSFGRLLELVKSQLTP
jgi:PilZ domain